MPCGSSYSLIRDQTFVHVEDLMVHWIRSDIRGRGAGCMLVLAGTEPCVHKAVLHSQSFICNIGIFSISLD
jgi:hypothetical protein